MSAATRKVGLVAGLAGIILLLSFNSFRYATQISNFWYFPFIICWWIFWRFIESRKRRGASLSFIIAMVLLLTYYLFLPKFTYWEAINELNEHYRQEEFSLLPNVTYQKLAPHIENGEVTYYYYVVESSGKYYYFDQYSGSYGTIVTDPKEAVVAQS